MKRIAIGILALALILGAQTQIDPNHQIRGLPAELAEIRGLIADALARIIALEDLIGGPTGSTRVYGELAVVDVGDSDLRTYVLAKPATNLSVWRDGVRATDKGPSPDYVVIDSQHIRFVAAFAGAGGAVVITDFDPVE